MSKYDIIPKSVGDSDTDDTDETESEPASDEDDPKRGSFGEVVDSDDEINTSNNTLSISNNGNKIKVPKRKAVNGKIISENLEERKPKDGEKRISLTGLNSGNTSLIDAESQKQNTQTQDAVAYEPPESMVKIRPKNKEKECKCKLPPSTIVVIVVFCCAILGVVIYFSIKAAQKAKMRAGGYEWIKTDSKGSDLGGASQSGGSKAEETKKVGSLFKNVPVSKSVKNTKPKVESDEEDEKEPIKSEPIDRSKTAKMRKRDARGRFVKS